jgi:hypothetical protein
VVSNYREGGISVFVLAYFISGQDELRDIREAVGVPLRVVRLTVPLPEIQERLAADMTTEQQEEALEAGRQIAAGEGVGVVRSACVPWAATRRPGRRSRRAGRSPSGPAASHRG